MKLNENNRSITYSGCDIVKVLQEIEYILGSLHNIGRYYSEKEEFDRSSYERDTTDFIDDSRVTERLARVRYLLSEPFDDSLGDDETDDLERACEDIDLWEKPNDHSEKFWIDDPINDDIS